MADERMGSDEPRRGTSGMGGIGEGIRSGLGILNAFKEAIEETIQEAVERGDLSPDRARQTMREATRRMQEGFGEARERFDFASRREYDELREEFDELRRRVEVLEATAPGGAPAAGAETYDPAQIPLDAE
jgi:polyhydroxyalkanoate synthesis regulator phasin